MRNLKDDVLAILKDDARTPVKEIAEMLGKDEAEIASVVEQLEKTGVIVKYTAVVNDERTRSRLCGGADRGQGGARQGKGF